MIKTTFRHWLCTGCPYLIIAGGGFLLYAQALTFDLTFLDDNVWIRDYHWYLKDASNLLSVFLQPDLITKVFFRPFIFLSFHLDARFGGTSPEVYHLTNILLHLLNANLVFIVFKKLGYDRSLAFVFSLVFVAHPVLTQAVVWIPGRTDTLLCAFVLVSFITFLMFLREHQWKYFACHTSFLIGGLLTKETAVALPVLCLGYLGLIYGPRFKNKITFVLCGTWTVTILCWLVVRWKILNGTQDIPLDTVVGSVFQNSPALLVYLGKVFFPVNLSVLPILEDSTLVYGTVAVGVLMLLLIISRARRINYVIFGMTWFLLFLLPTFVISFLIHEYRAYVPLIGCLIVVMELVRGGSAGSSHRGRLWLAMAVVIALLSSITVHYSRQYRDRFTFWQNAVSTSPHSPLAHRNLGAMYHLEGRLDKAAAAYAKALELNSTEKMVHNNLGLILKARKQYRLAEQEFLAEIRINPDYDNVYGNLGLLYFETGRMEPAREMWEKAISINPNYINAYKYLLILSLEIGDYAQANRYLHILREKGVSIPSALLQQIPK